MCTDSVTYVTPAFLATSTPYVPTTSTTTETTTTTTTSTSTTAPDRDGQRSRGGGIEAPEYGPSYVSIREQNGKGNACGLEYSAALMSFTLAVTNLFT